MIISKYIELVLEALKSYKQKYLEMLKSDLEQYENNAMSCLLKNSLNPRRKMIDVNFDTIEKDFEGHKFRMVNEEIEILENLDSSILEDLAYHIAINNFSFLKEETTYILPWFIDEHMSEPILNAILYLEKLKRRKINLVNYKRDLANMKKQLEESLELTEGFFHLTPVQLEDDILRILLTHMHQLDLNIESKGIKAIVFNLFPDSRKRLPKNLDVTIKGILINAGYYSKHAGGVITRE